MQIDDIKVEYHPKSHRPTKFYHLDDYAAQEGRPAEEPVTDQEPWKPFRTRLDFEIAELMLDSHLNVGQSSVLLSLIRKAIAQPADFTLSSTDELEKFWTAARETRGTGFEHKSVKVDYKAEEIEFQVSTRPIWSWIEDIVDNGNIVPLFKWDAERRYRYNGSKWERFINEPCTADDWWNIQSALPDNASPVFIIIYADKSRLSSFGTAKGYPVFGSAQTFQLTFAMARGPGFLWHLRVQILHQVTEDAGETRKKGYVNFKHIVWHKSLYEILDSIWLHGKTGFLKTCGDNIARWLWPIILILSADYEEQCIMTLIHGLGSNGPCPVCLVPPDELADLSKTFNLRTKENMMKIYKQAQELNATDKEELLKIYECFWDFKYCDPYQATSWDGLHAHDSGLFGAHILPELKCLVDVLGKEYAKLLDTQVDKTPRWSGLNHFREVMKMDFTDGGKFSDIAKLVLFAAYNILTKDESPEGYAILQLLRSYLELHMYTSLSLHSESTIEAGEKALLAFEIARQEYSRVSPTKNWHFIKAHITRNFSTKPNEKAHSPLKDFYQLMTNFKNFGVQILKLNEKDVISTMIREQITILDELAHRKLEEEVNNSTRKHHLIGTEHVSLSSALAPCTVEFIETNLGKGLTSIFCTRIDVGLYDEVSPYQALHVSYESVVSWGITTDIVRAHPNFYNSPRYDCVLVDAGQGKHFFARLLYIFGIFVESEVQYLALILPFDVPIPRIEQPRGDQDLQFTRATFIHIESIVRGALLIPAHDSQEYGDEFLVFDQLDEDFWMRMKSLQLAVSLNL
ncbi:hypothetical protein CPB84DRAFT_1903942 [Gymnopilus junonius]|uniref:Uncharacterized protein n=1 Tax=Gymnopilus junonius TaxID=109634 RepID=A0A9P5N8Z7_GYMJU|nr:hypothetical protein CPB84DRAFT_1903942 [Gymnopilus junonius]